MANNRLVKVHVKDFNAQPKERKHIILLDGTWNDETGIGADGNVTNVVHLKRLLKDDPEKQIVTYHRGVGNDNDNGKVRRILNAATGKDIKDIVNKAYARFVENWQKGDKVYIFGFSRGAATARLLAYKICQEGIPGRMEMILRPTVNKETNVVEQSIESFSFDNSRKEDTEIEFLGVWDTVAAIGVRTNFLKFMKLTTRNLFKDFHIAENIRKAVHLVAIDETRSIFAPALMNHKPGVTHEVWFPGVHSDIGGSYPEDEIAQVTLYYMIKCMEDWNVASGKNEFLFDTDLRYMYTSERIDHASFHFHGGEGLGKSIRTIGVQVNGEIDRKIKPKVHRLMDDIRKDNAAHAVFKVKEPESDKQVKRIVNFKYTPFQIELIREAGFDIVE